jgi:hypothetical protein
MTRVAIAAAISAFGSIVAASVGIGPIPHDVLTLFSSGTPRKSWIFHRQSGVADLCMALILTC